MKIVEIIPHLTSGGAERFTVDLCNEFAERHEVWLVLFFPLEDTGLHFLLPEVGRKVHVVSLNKHKGFDLGLVWRIKKTIKDISPDIVHCHVNSLEYVALARMFGQDRCRWYYTVHSDARYDAGQGIVNRIRRYAIRHKLLTPVTISDESLRSFRDFYGYEAPMIRNGRKLSQRVKETKSQRVKETKSQRVKETKSQRVKETKSQRVKETKSPKTLRPLRLLDPLDQKDAASLPMLVSLARFSQVKRQDMLARIAKRLEDEGYQFRLQLVGQHQDKEMLDTVMAVGCKSIDIVGEVNNPLDYLAEADVFCLCSSNEGMPISLIEAMAMGAVPVCTPVGGIVNVVKEGINGFLSDDITEEAYYKALRRSLDTPEDKIKEMSAQAVQAAQPFSMEECARKYEQLFQQFIIHN